jgi:hypothetical protein
MPEGKVLAVGPVLVSRSNGNMDGRHSYPHIAMVDRKYRTPGHWSRTLAVLLPAPLACCRFELEQRHMIPPSNFALRIIVEEDPKLVRKLNADYAYAAPDGGLDTDDRDTLLDVLGNHFTGRLWPRAGSMVATRRYMAELQRAMARARWSVDFFAVV